MNFNLHFFMCENITKWVGGGDINLDGIFLCVLINFSDV